MYDECDVLVVGAGPSGLSAGLSAVLRGLKVVVIERKSEVGVPVKCGEFLPNINEVNRLLSAIEPIKKMYAQFRKAETGKLIENVIGNAILNRIKKLRLYSPNNRRLEFNFDGIVISRESFEKSLAAEAERLGAILKTSTTIKAVAKKMGIKPPSSIMPVEKLLLKPDF
jgi:digeranylgeranylglycerophospholipid reductase